MRVRRPLRCALGWHWFAIFRLGHTRIWLQCGDCEATTAGWDLRPSSHVQAEWFWSALALKYRRRVRR